MTPEMNEKDVEQRIAVKPRRRAQPVKQEIEMLSVDEVDAWIRENVKSLDDIKIVLAKMIKEQKCKVVVSNQF